MEIDYLKFKGGDSDGPAVIASVAPNSPPAAQGLKPGDTVIEINDRPVASLDQAIWLLLNPDFPGETLRVRVAERPNLFLWSPTPPPEHSLRVHPAQLYSAIDAILLCLFLLAYSPFRRRDGELLAMLMTIHPISRFLLECLRVDEKGMFGTSLHISQIISLGLLVGAMALWAYILSRPSGLVWRRAETMAA